MSETSDLLHTLSIICEQRGKSVSTSTSYMRAARLFLVACPNFQSVTRREAAKLFAELSKGKSASWQKQMLAAIRLIYSHVDLANPFAGIELPKHDNERLEIRYLSWADLLRLFSYLKSRQTTYYGQLVYSLASTLFYTGARYHEVARAANFDLLSDGTGRPQLLRIKAKGKRFRDLLLPEPLRDVLSDWVKIRDLTKNLPTITNRAWIEFGRSELLFPSKNGLSYNNYSFNRQLLLACGRERLPVITAHGLRHSLAYHLLNDKRRNLREIQEILGHKLIGTTQRYTQVDREQLKAAVNSVGILP